MEEPFLAYGCEWVPVWVYYLGPELVDLEPSWVIVGRFLGIF